MSIKRCIARKLSASNKLNCQSLKLKRSWEAVEKLLNGEKPVKKKHSK